MRVAINHDFTEAEINILSKNKNVKNISSKQITYQDSFKELFIAEHNSERLPRDIFIGNGFDPEMIGQNHIDKCSCRRRLTTHRPEGVEISAKAIVRELKTQKMK